MSVFVETAPIVLASGSPRRQQFFRELGVRFEVVLPEAEEPRPAPVQAPGEYARKTARAKAREVAEKRPEAVVIAADTIVVLGDDILGKPGDEQESLAMLGMLAGKRHAVITAVCIIRNGSVASEFACTSRVRFHDWPHDVLAAYARTGESLDKAGAYAVQGLGAFLVAEIVGSWSSVVGLPVAELVAELLRLGIIAARS